MPDADEYLAMAGSDPVRVLEQGEAYLSGLGSDDDQERSVTLRALSLAARHTGDIADSIEYARLAAEVAMEAGLVRTALLATLTETGSRAISGDLEGSLRVIESVLAETVDDEMQAEFGYQRAAVLANLGHLGEAIEGFEVVLPAYERMGDRQAIMMTLNQLGRLATSAGHLGEAEKHLERALSLAKDGLERASLPGILHNLGLLAAYRGDIPDALQKLYESDELYMEVSGADAPQHVARCEVLLSVGLFAEALETAQAIARDRAAHGDVEHGMRALVIAARAALMAERHEEAMRLADEAAGALADAKDTPILHEARAIGVEARFHLEGPSQAIYREVLTLSREMSEAGQLVYGTHVKALAARISEKLGDIEASAELLAEVAAAATGPVELRLKGPLARARLAAIGGDRRGVLRWARSGLAMIDRVQEDLGATELRLGVEKQGTELAELGLRFALESGRPRLILDWLDLTRARALRHPPVTSGNDEAVGELLADRRRVESELRDPAKRDDPQLIRQRTSLERQIEARGRTRRGARRRDPHFSTALLFEELGDGVLYEVGAVDDHLVAIRVEKGRAHRVDLGEVGAVKQEIGHLRFAMRRAARRGRPLSPSALDEVAHALLGDARFGDSEIVVVPSPDLMAVPWAALAPLRGRAIVVAPSAEMWWRARRADSAGGQVTVAGGPDLAVAADEVQSVVEVHPGATRLMPGSTVDEVKAGLDGAAIAHIACHATFSFENPMFSSLRLGDGDLNVYDIERLERVPSLVVLSACDSGYTETRAGDELAGLTSALLSMGARNVVASVGLVPDSPATSELMVDFHRGLVKGLEPSRALAAAQDKGFEDPERFVSAASFICLGA